MPKIILDLEFTGLDNTFVKDNEIIQLKAINLNTGKAVCYNFGSNKELTTYPFLSHRIKKYDRQFFSSKEFYEIMLELNDDKQEEANNVEYWGFSPQMDMLMLAKYNIPISIKCIKEQLQLTKHEQTLATGGNSLECCYYVATGKIPNIVNHDGIEEIYLIKELYEEVLKLYKSERFHVMPFGHCSGMDLETYCINYRRQADGYRFNNNDLLSYSLNVMIEEIDKVEFLEDFDEDNNEW